MFLYLPTSTLPFEKRREGQLEEGKKRKTFLPLFQFPAPLTACKDDQAEKSRKSLSKDTTASRKSEQNPRPCQTQDPVRTKTLSEPRPCQTQDPVRTKTLSEPRPCQTQDPFRPKTLSEPRPCQNQDPVRT